MLEIAPAPVSSAAAHELLAEYFAFRAERFPGGGYQTVFPAADAFTGPGEAFVVARAEGRPVGCGAVRTIAPGPRGARAEIKHLYVRGEGRGRGWGGAILDDLEARAREAGAAELVLDTHHTLDAAGGLYASRGFTAIERYNDNANATRWYGKPLD